MPSPSALCKQLTFLEMASFWHSHGWCITRKAWLTWIETKWGYFDDMLSVSFFENFELIYWFLDVPQMTIHFNTPANHQAKNACVYTVHITSLWQVKSAVISLCWRFWKAFFNQRWTETKQNCWIFGAQHGPTKIFASQRGFNSALQYSIGYFTQIVSCHFISNSMLLVHWCVLSLRWSWHFSRPTFTKGSWCETTELLLAIT